MNNEFENLITQLQKHIDIETFINNLSSIREEYMLLLDNITDLVNNIEKTMREINYILEQITIAKHKTERR